MTRKQFISFITPLHDDLFRLAMAMTGIPDEANDAVQETLLKLWKARERIPPDKKEASAYCFKALRLNCFTLLKRRSQINELQDMELPANHSSDSEVIYSQSQTLLLKIIEHLPENQRIVIRLTAMEGCDISRTARLTGLTEANVRQLLSRGRKFIRERFDRLND